MKDSYIGALTGPQIVLELRTLGEKLDLIDSTLTSMDVDTSKIVSLIRAQLDDR